jgi:hypothetical protein
MRSTGTRYTLAAYSAACIADLLALHNLDKRVFIALSSSRRTHVYYCIPASLPLQSVRCFWKLITVMQICTLLYLPCSSCVAVLHLEQVQSLCVQASSQVHKNNYFVVYCKFLIVCCYQDI